MGNNVSAAKPKVGGAVSVAPAGTALPTDATTALAEAFKQLGYISEDGLTNKIEISTDSVKAWGGDEVLVTDNGRTVSYGYTLIEATNADVLKQVFGEDNVTGTLETGIHIAIKSNVQLPEQVVVIDMVLKDGALKRIVIPAGRITEVGEITYNDGDPIGYEVTLSATPDASGNTAHEYIKAASNG